MSNLGVFHWIRESVRRAVLLGFSDAVEQIGAPNDANEALHPGLVTALRQSATALEQAPEPRPAAKSERKRLGRSLDQLRQSAARPAEGT